MCVRVCVWLPSVPIQFNSILKFSYSQTSSSSFLFHFVKQFVGISTSSFPLCKNSFRFLSWLIFFLFYFQLFKINEYFSRLMKSEFRFHFVELWSIFFVCSFCALRITGDLKCYSQNPMGMFSLIRITKNGENKIE